MVEQAVQHAFAVHPTGYYIGSKMPDGRNNRHKRQTCKGRTAKSQGQEMVDNEPDERQSDGTSSRSCRFDNRYGPFIKWL